MIRPLVQHRGLKWLRQLGNGILRHHRCAELGDEGVDTVVHLRVHVVGPARQNDDPPSLLPGGGDDLRTLFPDLLHVTLVFSVGRLHRRLDLSVGNGAKLPLHHGGHLLREIMGPVDTHIVINEFRVLQTVAVARQNLRVVGHHRAVVVVLAQTLVDVVGHAGVENGVHAQLGQKFNVAVGQLRREAGGVAGDAPLPLQIQLSTGHGAVDHLKAKFREKCVPEGIQFPEVQTQGQPDPPPPVLPRLVA